MRTTPLQPRDWNTDGGVYWETSTYCLSDFVNRRFLAQSPDGRLAFEMLPTLRWQWGQSQLIRSEIQMRGCRVAPPVDAAGALREYVLPRFRPGAAVRDVSPAPEAARGIQEEYLRIWGPLYRMQGTTVNAQAVRATLEYSQDGRAFEERLLFGVGQRAAIWSQAMGEIGQTRAETGQRSQEALSRVSRSWSRALRGVDSYLDPASGQSVELPTGYRNAWGDGSGNYLLTPDLSFNPNSALDRGDWQRMQRQD